MTLTIIYQN